MAHDERPHGTHVKPARELSSRAPVAQAVAVQDVRGDHMTGSLDSEEGQAPIASDVVALDIPDHVPAANSRQCTVRLCCMQRQLRDRWHTVPTQQSGRRTTTCARQSEA